MKDTLCKKKHGLIDFIPQANWHWLFDHNRATLTLNMGRSSIDIVYKPAMLTLQFDQAVFFTMEDVANYIDLFEDSALAGYQPELRCRIILHILVANQFHKPIMPKNWLFESNDGEQQEINKGDHVILKSLVMKEAKKYLVLDNGANFILCMLIEKSHGLTVSRTFSQFQVVKVTYDKISASKADYNALC
ncbi:MAG: cell division protein ZapC [Psychromonas sp.]